MLFPSRLDGEVHTEVLHTTESIKSFLRFTLDNALAADECYLSSRRFSNGSAALVISRELCCSSVVDRQIDFYQAHTKTSTYKVIKCCDKWVSSTNMYANPCHALNLKCHYIQYMCKHHSIALMTLRYYILKARSPDFIRFHLFEIKTWHFKLTYI